MRTRVWAVLALILAVVPAVHACDACFGAEESPLIDGAKLGAFALVAVTLSVQGGFAWFFVQLRRRARRAARLELDAEWNEFQKTPRDRS